MLLGSRFLVLACAVSMALGACAAPSTDNDAAPASSTEQQPDPERMDAKLLAIPTVIDARKVRLVLSARWRSSTKLEGIHADKSDAMKWIARGSAELRLKELRINASDEITVTFLDDHEDFVLHATDVALYKRTKGKIVNRQERVKAVTIANGQVSILSGQFGSNRMR